MSQQLIINTKSQIPNFCTRTMKQFHDNSMKHENGIQWQVPRSFNNYKLT